MIEIKPSELLEMVRDVDKIHGSPGDEFCCDGLSVFRIDDSGEVQQACMRYVHGVHERFMVMSEELRRLTNAGGMPSNVTCNDCGGIGWIAIDDPVAVRNRILALSCGVFRGIELPQVQQQLTAEGIAATVGSRIMSLPHE